MIAFERLKLEVDGISGVLEKYTRDGSVHNHLNQLKRALEESLHKPTMKDHF